MIRVMSRPRELKAPLQRERSLQDIDKDIETIWKELQDLDTPAVSERTQGGTDGTDRSMSIRRETENIQSLYHYRDPSVHLSEQVLVTPSWRQSQSPSVSRPSVSNPNLSRSSRQQRHTIWDIPEPSDIGQTKPNYFPTKSNNHFSFLPRPETRPGSIAPLYGPTGWRPPPASTSSQPAPHKCQESRKSCLKSQSTQSLKSRSQSPSVVKFSPKLPQRVSGKSI